MSTPIEDVPRYPGGTRVRVTNHHARGSTPTRCFGGEWEIVCMKTTADPHPYLVKSITEPSVRQFTFWVGAVEPIIHPVTDEEMAYVRQSLGLPQQGSAR